ncbi:hypothetical protein BCR44DRAFT_34338 [Catenaria anguillulae PL171]|uniref:Uncharacterized protein n=1 Tax=Catenaria anguillulae PL171 TaxID=765915 RepID=A0A1Y2HKR3_9FUNG|nr:hypothetical protein BCR44DRAFT_34338 [Catenaria anguillulae PL171]
MHHHHHRPAAVPPRPPLPLPLPLPPRLHPVAAASGTGTSASRSGLVLPLAAAAVILHVHLHLHPRASPAPATSISRRLPHHPHHCHAVPFHHARLQALGPLRSPFRSYSSASTLKPQPQPHSKPKTEAQPQIDPEVTAQQLRTRQIDDYVRDWKRHLAEHHGIRPVITNPDVYVAQTALQANLLAALFRLDPFVGMDAKLVPMQYIDPQSVRHLRRGGGAVFGAEYEPIMVQDGTKRFDDDIERPAASLVDLHASSTTVPAGAPPPPYPPPSASTFLDALHRAMPSDLLAYLPPPTSATTPELLLTPHRGLPTPSNPRPVSLLQLASHHTCVLFQVRRILLSPPHTFPSTLRSILASRSLAKFATHGTRLRLQLSHSYALMPAATIDIRDACERAGIGAPGAPHPATAPNGPGGPGASGAWTELDMLYRPGNLWTVRAPPYANYAQWDWDAKHLDEVWVRQAADEAFLRYLVGLRLTKAGLAPAYAAATANHAAADQDQYVREAQAVLELMHKYIRKRSAVAVGRSVPVKKTVEYVMAQYAPWRVRYGEQERRRKVVQVLLDACREGKASLVSGAWWADPQVDASCVDYKVVTQRNYYVRLPKALSPSPGQDPASTSSEDARITPPTANRIDLTPADTLDLGASVSDNDMYAAGPFKPDFVRRLGRHIAQHVRLAHPNLLSATADPSSPAFKPTTTRDATLKFIRNAPSLHRLPLNTSARHALAEHVYRHLVLDGCIVYDARNAEDVAWAPGTPGQVSVGSLVRQFGTCPDVLLHKCLEAVRLTSAVRASRAMSQEAMVNVLVSGTQMVAWVRALVSGQGMGKQADQGILDVDAEGAKMLARWVIQGWASKGLVAEFTDAVSGSKFVMLRGFGAAVQSAPVVDAMVALPIAHGSASSTSAAPIDASADAGWHRDLMYVQCGHVRTDRALHLPSISPADVHALRLALCKQFAMHLQELSLSAFHTWLRNSFPRSQLVSPGLMRLPGQADFTDVQVAGMADALVRSGVLVPTVARGKYVVNHALPMSKHAATDAEGNMGQDHWPVPRPYVFPALGLVKSAVVPKLQAAEAASDTPLTPFTVRRHIVHVVMAAHRDMSERKAQEVGEWCVWVMQRKGWIEAVRSVRLAGAAKAEVARIEAEAVANEVRVPVDTGKAGVRAKGQGKEQKRRRGLPNTEGSSFAGEGGQGPAAI